MIPIFDGDRRRMETGNLNSQPAYIDHALATTEYRLLQLQRYPCGDALKWMDRLVNTGYVYQAAKEDLERKYGGQPR